MQGSLFLSANDASGNPSPDIRNLCIRNHAAVLPFWPALGGRDVPPLTPKGFRVVSRASGRGQNHRLSSEGAPFILVLSVPHPPSVRQSVFRAEKGDITLFRYVPDVGGHIGVRKDLRELLWEGSGTIC